MIWNNYYLPPDPILWRGRSDSPSGVYVFQIIQMLNLLETAIYPIKSEKNIRAFAFIGFCCDEGIRRNLGRPGAAEGPKAIRQAMATFPILKQDVQILDAGNITCINGDLAASQEALGEVVALLLSQKITPIVLGGGHELAWGHYQGIASAFPTPNLGIINFDAHFDMRPLLPDSQGASDTPFLQIAKAHLAANRRLDYNCVGIQHHANIRPLLETAKEYNTKVIWADELHQGHFETCVDFIDRIIDQNDIIYLTVSLDVFASSYAPGVSVAQPLGLHPWHVIPLIRQLASAGKVISYDIAELSPQYDIDQMTAKLAASFIFEFIHHHNEEPRKW